MIPIRDESGNVIAFGARAIDEGQNPKYLNSPDTVFYNKSRVLYGIDKAKKRAEELAAKYGERFTPPTLLKTKAEQKQNIQ